MKTKGVLYICHGKEYIQEALRSVKSLKRHMSNLPISLVCSEASFDNSEGLFDQVILLPAVPLENKEGYLYKIRGFQASPYDETLFLDSDTYVLRDFSEVFRLCDAFEMALCHDVIDLSLVCDEQGKVVEAIQPYNTGVILYRSSQNTKEFFALWESIFLERHPHFIHDQPAFMEALWRNPLCIYQLHNIYNLRIPYSAYILPLAVKILHGRHLDFDKVGDRINREADKPRLWSAWNLSVTVSKHQPKYRIYNLLPPFLQKLAKRTYLLIWDKS